MKTALKRVAPLGLLLGVLAGPATPAEAFGPFPVPRGYTVYSKQWVTSNIYFYQLRSTNPRRVVNVMFFRHGGSEHIRTVISNERVAGPSPTTEVLSSMCKRVNCIVGVNGDFFSNTTGQPAGGMAADGIPIRTPPEDRYHFVADWAGNVRVRKISLPITFTVTYPNGQHPYYVHHVNTPRDYNRAIIYTPKWGPSTQTDGSGYEIVMKVNNPPVLLNKKLDVQIISGAAKGNTSIPSNGLVLSGSGAYVSEFSKLWSDVHSGSVPANASLTLGSVPDLRAYVGGTPALLLGGKQAWTSNGSSYYTTAQPRTMVGRTYGGDTIFVQVDGRQPSWSVGMNLSDGTNFMHSIGAWEALNLDNGGSSEFVRKGVVVDKPSDGRERSIAAALVIVA